MKSTMLSHYIESTQTDSVRQLRTGFVWNMRVLELEKGDVNGNCSIKKTYTFIRNHMYDDRSVFSTISLRLWECGCSGLSSCVPVCDYVWRTLQFPPNPISPSFLAFSPSSILGLLLGRLRPVVAAVPEDTFRFQSNVDDHLLLSSHAPSLSPPTDAKKSGVIVSIVLCF